MIRVRKVETERREVEKRKYNSQIQAFIFVSCILRRKEKVKKRREENILINARITGMHIYI